MAEGSNEYIEQTEQVDQAPVEYVEGEYIPEQVESFEAPAETETQVIEPEVGAPAETVKERKSLFERFFRSKQEVEKPQINVKIGPEIEEELPEDVAKLRHERAVLKTEYMLLSNKEEGVERSDLARNVAHQVAVAVREFKQAGLNVSDTADGTPQELQRKSRYNGTVSSVVSGTVADSVSRARAEAQNNPDVDDLTDPEELASDLRFRRFADEMIQSRLLGAIQKSVTEARSMFSAGDFRVVRGEVIIPKNYIEAIQVAVDTAFDSLLEESRDYAEEKLKKEIIWGEDEGVQSIPQVTETVMRIMLGSKMDKDNRVAALSGLLAKNFKGNEAKQLDMLAQYRSFVIELGNSEPLARAKAERDAAKWMGDIVAVVSDGALPEREDLEVWLKMMRQRYDRDISAEEGKRKAAADKAEADRRKAQNQSQGQQGTNRPGQPAQGQGGQQNRPQGQNQGQQGGQR